MNKIIKLIVILLMLSAVSITILSIGGIISLANGFIISILLLILALGITLTAMIFNEK